MSTTIPKRKPKVDPLTAPIADEKRTLPASDRIVSSSDNVPPRPRDSAVAEFNDALKQREGFLQRIDDLVVSAGRAKADNDESAGRCADLIRQIKAAAKFVDEQRKFIKDPYLDAGRGIDEEARKYSAKLDEAEAKVRRIAEDYARKELHRQQEEARKAEAERQRLLREEEERRAAAAAKGEPAPEYEPVDAPAPAPAPSFKVTGDYGSSASTAKVWKAEVQDWDKAYKAVRDNDNVKEAIQTAINRRIKAGDRKIAGVRIYEDVGLRVR